MPRTLAAKRERWAVLTTKPQDPNAVTVAEATAGIRVECDMLASGSRISATGSTTVTEQAICESTAAQVPENRQFEGSVTPFLDIDPDTGLPVTEGDEAWELFREFGTRLWVLVSKGPLYTEAFAADHPYSLYEVVTDEPQEPSERSGYMKKVVPLFVQDAWTNKQLVAGAA